VRTVDHDADATGEQDRFEALPARVHEALGELAGAAKQGLLALSVGVGLGVLAELMDEEVDEVVGPQGRHDPGRSAVRHGRERGEVTLGGRRVGVERRACAPATAPGRWRCRPTGTSPTATR
jgi:putative transposase